MKKFIPMLVVAAVVGGVIFYGGMKFAQGQNPRQLFTANAEAMFRGGQGRGGANGGFTAGSVIAKDDKSITVQLNNGGSKIVFYSGSTEVGKFVSGAMTDVTVGQTVTVMGQANPDGSITAQSIQIRPSSASSR